MSIIVCGLHNVLNFVQDADLIISITDSKKHSPFPDTDNPKIVKCVFEDTEHPDDVEFMRIRHGVLTVLEAVSNKKLTLDSKIVVHCHAGVSRSSAMSWLILIKLGMDFKEAFTLLFKQHPNIWPNKTLLGIGGSIMGLPVEFNAFVSQVDAEIALSRSEFLGYGG